MTVTALNMNALHLGGQQEIGFYRESCPRAEEAMSEAMRMAINRDPTLAAALLRIHYHDRFIGCRVDASIPLDQPPGYPPMEKVTLPNQNLRGFEMMDMLKRILESICPGTVSCADILALSTKEAVTCMHATTTKFTLPTSHLLDPLFPPAFLLGICLYVHLQRM
ncbi:peroxidase 2 [Amborella trichopoda]|nr:peroxidase 2 [Amborella trichopoda]|eukprot:XP_006844036.2 peroxidase 2 [Amborella trichopoda]